MRKASREMDSQWALEVMRKAPYITVSFTRADGSAYGVPLSLACTSEDVWYFHCAPEGDKLDAIAVHPEVCLSAVTKCQPTVGPKDGTFTLQYRSAIAFGKAERVTDTEEKIEALRVISQRFIIRKSKFPWFPERSVQFSGKRTKRSVQKKRLHTTLIKPEQKVNEDLCSGFIVS